MGKKKLRKRIARLKRENRRLARALERSVMLPTDRRDMPIGIGDTLVWDDGDTLKVAALTFYGLDFESVGCWDAMDEGEKYADNLGVAVNATKLMEGQI